MPMQPGWWNPTNRDCPFFYQVRDYMSWYCHGYVPQNPPIPIPNEFFELRDKIILELEKTQEQPAATDVICAAMAKKSPTFDMWARRNLK
jgi:hypothetical protein